MEPNQLTITVWEGQHGDATSVLQMSRQQFDRFCPMLDLFEDAGAPGMVNFTTTIQPRKFRVDRSILEQIIILASHLEATPIMNMPIMNPFLPYETACVMDFLATSPALMKVLGMLSSHRFADIMMLDIKLLKFNSNDVWYRSRRFLTGRNDRFYMTLDRGYMMHTYLTEDVSIRFDDYHRLECAIFEAFKMYLEIAFMTDWMPMLQPLYDWVKKNGWLFALPDEDLHDVDHPIVLWEHMCPERPVNLIDFARMCEYFLDAVHDGWNDFEMTRASNRGTTLAHYVSTDVSTLPVKINFKLESEMKVVVHRARMTTSRFEMARR